MKSAAGRTGRRDGISGLAVLEVFQGRIEIGGHLNLSPGRPRLARSRSYLAPWVMCMAGWTLLLFQKLHEVQYLSHGRLGQLFKMLVDKLGVGHD